ncbi:DUF2141 domain-containing protein [Flavobacteriaceae bacterium Ap0902]|nr:DUF2141 domain-containing protein [Flavobacteriaceae bacterium Ap0902]
MKKIILILSLITATISFSQTAKINIEVDGITNNQGNIGIALYNNANDFTIKEYRATKVKAKQGKVYAAFDEIPAGEYGIAILHDENKNDKMDFNMIGIPKEDYGFSNNPAIVLSKPKFKEVAFPVKKGESKKVKIKLK